MTHTRLLSGIATMALAMASADAATFSYQGDDLDDLLNGRDIQLGAIVGTISFDPSTFTAGAALGLSDIADFSFSVGGITWTLADADFVSASFNVNALGNGFSSFGLSVEDDVLSDIDGAEQLSISDGVLFSAQFQAVTLGDVFLNSPSTSVPSAVILGQDGGFFEVSGPGVFTFDADPVPLPGALPLFAAGVLGLGWMRRRTNPAKSTVHGQ